MKRSQNRYVTVRTYSKDTRKIIKRVLRNAIKAVDQGLVNDPGDLGVISYFLKQIALKGEEITDSDSMEIDHWFHDMEHSNGKIPYAARNLVKRVVNGWMVLEKPEPDDNEVPEVKKDSTNSIAGGLVDDIESGVA